MIVTIPAPSWPPNGPRPINLNRDIPQVVALLELSFGEKMDRGGQQMMHYSNPGGQPAMFGWLHSQFNRLAPGYVWQEDNRIVGNVTLIATKIPGRHIVANVAVHPDYRRRGIARALMDAVMDQARARHGEVVMLQVVQDNYPAINLYKSLGFYSLGNMTTWRASVSRLHEILPTNGEKDLLIRPMRRSQWHAAYQVDIDSLHPDLNWPEPIPQPFYKTGFWQTISNFMNGRRQETWVVTDKHGHLAGVASIINEWLQAYEMTFRVPPRWHGQVERPLLAKLVHRLQGMSQRNIRIHHAANDEVVNNLLKEANFSAQRTLTHMRWNVTYDHKGASLK